MKKEELWHRRQAVMLASQLPEGHEDALLIIRAVERLANGFLSEGGDKPPAPVLKLREV